MELNYDCFRDVLLTLESCLQVEERPDKSHALLDNASNKTCFCFSFVTIDTLMGMERIKKYTKSEVLYALYNLDQAKFVEADIEIQGMVFRQCIVYDITYQGHMFLKNIHDDSIWHKTKSKISAIGGAALPIVTEVAANLILKRIEM